MDINEGVAVFGAPPDTFNLGVSALLSGALSAVHDLMPDAPITVFDNGFGVRSSDHRVGAGSVPIVGIGARHSKRLHRGDTLANITVRAHLPRGDANPAIDALRRAALVFDISGGDSFSDIYGWERLSSVLLHKHLALTLDRPLVLLPQTYGPFESRIARRLSVRVLRQVEMAWARDAWSYDRLVELLGDDFDPARHRAGVDLAFGLSACEPPIDDDLAEWLEGHRPVAGINVSGMLYLDERSHRRFGLAENYREMSESVVRGLIERTDASVLLVPHNTAPDGHPQSDGEAARRLLGRLGDLGARVRLAPTLDDPSEAKGLIAMLDWFCGARMHATIAGLSSGVPTASLAYSPKAAGVFATAGMEEHVVDGRSVGAGESVDRLVWSFDRREAERDALAARVPELRSMARAPVREAFERSGALARRST